jgi:formylglycine-generating enzyme required for sulfatase activity
MPVQSYWKNNYNLYHMLGNVSELTSDSMIKGLNFLTQPNGESFVPGIHFQREADTIPNGYTIKSYMKYEKPAAWLGFRCVCEVK